MAKSREDILRQIKGLRALESGNGTEAEMLSAAETRARLMAKYNIELHELDDGDVDIKIESIAVLGKYNETWRRRCFDSGARMFFCNYFYRSRPGSDMTIEHVLIGEAHNLAVAREMAIYFEATINRLGNDAAKANKDVTQASHTDRHRFIRTFRLACADRLHERIDDYVGRAREGKLLDVETGAQLPALLSLYEQQRLNYEAWQEANGITIRSVRSRDQGLSARGRKLGREAGDSIALTTQVGGASSRHALPSS